MKPSQSVLDALSDAETLRLFARGYGEGMPECVAAWNAGTRGELAAAQLDPRWAAGLTRNAARAAFRAVPGLRG